MKTDLEWLITKSGLKNIRCITGKNLLGTRLDGVSVMDSPNSTRWIKQDELVVTTGYFLLNDEKNQREVVREAKKNGCAGMGIKIKSYFDEIPAVMIQEAEKIELPLLEIPYYYSLSEISQTVYNRVFETNYHVRVGEQRLIEDISDIFFSRRGVMEVIYRIAEYLKKTVILTNGDFRCMYAAKRMADKDICAKGDEIHRISVSEENHDIFGFPDHTQKQAYCVSIPEVNSHLIVLENVSPLTKGEEYLLGRCIKILSMCLEQVRAKHAEEDEFDEIGAQRLFEYLTGLRQYDQTALKSLIQEIGFSMEKMRIVLIVHTDHEETVKVDYKDVVEKSVAACKETKKMEYRIFYHNHRYVVYLFADTDQGVPFMEFAAEKLAESILKRIKSISRELLTRIGVSKCSQDMEGVRRSYLEAEKALEIGKKTANPERVYLFGRLIVYDYLMQYPLKDKKPLCENIRFLLKYDAQNNTELTKTLMKFLECKFNLSETAKELFIHRNTLINRMNRIKEILHNDLDEMDTLLPLCMEVYAYKLFS